MQQYALIGSILAKYSIIWGWREKKINCLTLRSTQYSSTYLKNNQNALYSTVTTMNIFFFLKTQFIFLLNFIIEFEDEVFMSSLYFSSTLKASRWASQLEAMRPPSPTVAARRRRQLLVLLYRTVDQYRLFHSKFIFSRAFQLMSDLKNEITRPESEACLEKAGLTKARSFNLRTKTRPAFGATKKRG